MKYRKKPVVIDAEQWDGSYEHAVKLVSWMGGANYGLANSDPPKLYIITMEGTMRADPGDWVIRGVKGEFYPCKPDIFEQTYEPAPPIGTRE